jgi:hypothetical protein
VLQWHHVPAPLFQTALRLQTILDTSSSLSEHSQEITALLLQHYLVAFRRSRFHEFNSMPDGANQVLFPPAPSVVVRA